MTRARVVALACGVVAAGAVYGLWWVSSERTLGFVGTGGGGPIGMRQVASFDASSYDSTYASTLSELTPLHDLHIGAGADADIAFVLHTHGPCSKIATPPHEFESSEIGGVRLAYTMLGVFHQQAWVPMVENLPDDGSEGYLFSVATPHPSTCPAGYPPEH